MKISTASFDFSFEDSLTLTPAKAELLRRAKFGLVDALRDLGCSYIWGDDGFPKDQQRARFWYLVAAENGHTEAMWDVATMCLEGEGGPKDVALALKLLKRAASRRRWGCGCESAASVLTQIYTEGLAGEPVDPEQAAIWRERSRMLHRKYRGWKRTLKAR